MDSKKAESDASGRGLNPIVDSASQTMGGAITKGTVRSRHISHCTCLTKIAPIECDFLFYGRAPSGVVIRDDETMCTSR
jgi:hypothetical protein